MNTTWRLHGRPVIGAALYTPETGPRSWAIGRSYVLALASAGASPWPIPLLADDAQALRAIYDHLDGLLLTGGDDIDPAHYGEQLHPLCGRIDAARDRVELTLTRWALQDRKPILAICRGHQVVNVAAGGTLYQDLAALHPRPIKHDYFDPPGAYARDFLAHGVRIAPSRLGDILGAHDIRVNSLHHQGIKTLAPSLVPSAWADDGLVEGLEAKDDQFLLSVQWHPEELLDADPRMGGLFAALVAAAREFGEARVTAPLNLE